MRNLLAQAPGASGFPIDGIIIAIFALMFVGQFLFIGMRMRRTRREEREWIQQQVPELDQAILVIPRNGGGLMGMVTAIDPRPSGSNWLEGNTLGHGSLILMRDRLIYQPSFRDCHPRGRNRRETGRDFGEMGARITQRMELPLNQVATMHMVGLA